MKPNVITIIGKTSEGIVFRPSDWHLRLADLAGNVDNHNRIQYNQFVSPTWVTCEGVPGLLINKELEHTDLMLYNFIRDFVLDNDLRVMYAEETDECAKRDVGHIKDTPTSIYDF